MNEDEDSSGCVQFHVFKNVFLVASVSRLKVCFLEESLERGKKRFLEIFTISSQNYSFFMDSWQKTIFKLSKNTESTENIIAMNLIISGSITEEQKIIQFSGKRRLIIQDSDEIFLFAYSLNFGIRFGLRFMCVCDCM